VTRLEAAKARLYDAESLYGTLQSRGWEIKAELTDSLRRLPDGNEPRESSTLRPSFAPRFLFSQAAGSLLLLVVEAMVLGACSRGSWGVVSLAPRAHGRGRGRGPVLEARPPSGRGHGERKSMRRGSLRVPA
jgi:hypothetical protein